MRRAIFMFLAFILASYGEDEPAKLVEVFPHGGDVPWGTRFRLRFDKAPGLVTIITGYGREPVRVQGTGMIRISQAFETIMIVSWGQGEMEDLWFNFNPDMRGDALPGFVVKTPLDGRTDVVPENANVLGMRIEFTEKIASANLELQTGGQNLRWEMIIPDFEDGLVAWLRPNPDLPIQPATTYTIVGQAVSRKDEILTVNIVFTTKR